MKVVIDPVLEHGKDESDTRTNVITNDVTIILDGDNDIRHQIDVTYDGENDETRVVIDRSECVFSVIGAR